MLRFASGIWFAFVLSTGLFARDPHFFLFNTNNGLPSSEVYRTIQDEEGKYWFATDRGVCRYDGYDFKAYTTKEGLANNTSLRVKKDPWGNLWFMGVDGSLSYWNGTSIRPFPLKLDPFTDGYGVPADLGWGIDGKMFILLRNYIRPKLLEVDLKTLNIEVLLHEDFDPSWLAYQDEDQRYWDVGGALVPEKILPTSVLRHGNELFYEAAGRTGVLRKGILEGGEPSQVYDLGVYISKIDVDHNGNLWVSTRDGLALFRGRDISIEPQWFFRGLSISSFWEDNEGNCWLTTLDKGVLMIPSFDVVPVDFEVGSEENERVISLLPLEKHLLFGTLSGRVMAVDTQGLVTEMANSPMNYGQFGWTTGSGKKGILGKFSIEEFEGDLILKPIPGYVESARALELKSKELILGMNPGYKVLGPGRQVKCRGNGFEKRVLCMLEMEDEVWAGTPGGLWAISTLTPYSYRQIFPKSLSLSGRINSLQSDGFGGAFAGTIGEGLVHIREGEIYVLSDSTGLSGNMINQIFLEKPGVLWLATNLGLDQVRYSIEGGFKVKEIKNYNTSDGLPENQIQSVAIWRDHVWVASSEGLFFFSQDTIDANRSNELRKVLWDRVTVNNRAVSPEGEHQLSYEENDLAFRFLTVSLRKSTPGVFYRYRLVGSSAGWEYTNDRTVRYPDLAPGSYRFEAEARNHQGNWSAEPATFSFVIAPHFSQTNWFRGMIFVLIIGLVVGALLYRSRRYRRKVEDRRKLQEARLRAQEAEITILRNQMNPHFVFNALNSIQNFIFKRDPSKASHYLSRFSNLMRDGLRFSREETIPLSEELGFVRTYIELESMRFPDRFSFELLVDDELDTDEIRIPPFLFQPLLENAVKHAFKDIDYQGELVLELGLEGEDLLVATVRDNGPGFNPEEAVKNIRPHHSMGLKIVRDRISLLNAAESGRKAKFELVNLSTLGGKGTQANFSIPI